MMYDLFHELNKIRLEIDRLNTLRNFTRQPGEPLTHPLSWQVGRYLQLHTSQPLRALLHTITAYGSLARGAGEAEREWSNNPEWLWTFNRIGEALFFQLPQALNFFDAWRFEKNSAAAFRIGWRGDSLPSPL